MGRSDSCLFSSGKESSLHSYHKRSNNADRKVTLRLFVYAESDQTVRRISSDTFNMLISVYTIGVCNNSKGLRCCEK